MRDELDDLLDHWRKSDGSYPSDVYRLVEMARAYRIENAELKAQLREALVGILGATDTRGSHDR